MLTWSLLRLFRMAQEACSHPFRRPDMGFPRELLHLRPKCQMQRPPWACRAPVAESSHCAQSTRQARSLPDIATSPGPSGQSHKYLLFIS
jgi:hypothetical protein